MNTPVCPTCGHPDTHSALVGCLNVEGCDCSASWAPPKTLEDAHQERDAAMAQVSAGTSPEWKTEAEKAVTALATRGEDFTPDDVWDYLTEREVTAPREPRALGPILKRLSNANVIRAKGFTESRRRHGSPVRVYEAGSAL